MLYLLNQEGGPNFFYLISGKEYTVGRKNTDIILANDQSISRQHAIIKVLRNSIKVMDCDSKYGTFYKGNKIQPNLETYVEDQDIIKFGVFQSIYKIEKPNIVTTGSGLSSSQKNALKKNIEFLGGIFLNHWDSTCTHLTVQEIILTVKVLHALIDEKPLVTFEFWDKYVQNLKENKPPPDVEDFRPEITDVLLDTSVVKPNIKRKFLFKGKTFVFPTDKIKSKMEDLILKTGGECISWERQPLTLSRISSLQYSHIFIYSDEIKELPNSLQVFHEHIKKLGQRIIPIEEIATAVMMCSCEQDCNPHFDKAKKVFCKLEKDPSSEKILLAVESQSQQQMTQLKQEVVIPSSLDSDVDSWEPVNFSNNNKEHFSLINHGASTAKVNVTVPSSSKRTLEDGPESSLKRSKLDESSTPTLQALTIESSKKRKADDNWDPPPKKSSLKENPFAIFRKRSSRQIQSDNPFTGLRVKQEKVLHDNPFVKPVEQNNEINESVDASLKDGPSSKSLTKSPLSFINKENCGDFSKTKWLSTVSSNDIQKKSDIEEYEQQYTVIQVLPLTSRLINLSDTVNGTHHSDGTKNINLSDTVHGTRQPAGTKNFKIFKKVLLHPQVQIIKSFSQMDNINSNEVTVLLDSEEDDDEVPRPVSKKTNKSRRFNF